MSEVTAIDPVEELEGVMLSKEGMASLGMVEVECPLKHEFTPGIYLRTIVMPTGARVIGHKHLTEHFNVVLAGHALVMMDGIAHEVKAPCVFVSKPGVRKVLQILETMVWATVHANPDDETNIEKLEERYIVKSATWLAHAQADSQALDHFMQTPSLEIGGNP